MDSKSDRSTQNAPQGLAETYQPQQFETKWTPYWEDHGFFEGKDDPALRDRSFSISFPPPNVTGVLHMGHALGVTLQDLLIRWKRMSGFNTMWLPGYDHAGIATQVQVEKQIAKENAPVNGRPYSRHDMGRDRFLERTWKWKRDHESVIKDQCRRMGASFDWKRERFTLDDSFVHAVRTVFVQLYKEGLIYRGERMINWDTISQTALSDLEVEPTERKGSLWHIRYPIAGTKEYVVIATTRPETLLGDTALAIHPEDERYLKLHGKKARVPFVNREIPIVLDDYVDPAFGSGALKVTPAHDFNDFDIGVRHELERVQVIGFDGRMTEAAGPYQGLKVAEARERIVQDLEAQGLLEKVEDHVHRVGLSQRTGIPAEPLISKQWFVKIAPLAEPAIRAVEDGTVTFHPETWKKTYFEWMYNIRDWCISRQLWWGHRIPAWHCSACEKITVSVEDIAVCEHCGSQSVVQDEDVLDTWFSSGLWPFGTLGWPEKTKALETFYPNSVMETGFDILFFWVARMMMMGIHFMGKPPFERVYLHAMVRDEHGNKMSKSRGNVIDPMESVNAHGADPLRFTLAAMAGQGRDIKLSEQRILGYRAFCNKLWNATRFFHLQNAGTLQVASAEENAKWILSHKSDLLPAHRWILSELQDVAERMDAALERFDLQEACQAIYDFTWYEFCDWFVEFSKLAPGEATLRVLHYGLDQILKLLHPIIPFVTEELWQSLYEEPHKKGVSLCVQPFPKKRAEFVDADAAMTLAGIKRIVESLRQFRGENRISPKKQFSVWVKPQSENHLRFLRINEEEICALSKVEAFHSGEETRPKGNDVSTIVLPEVGLEFWIKLDGLVDLTEEIQRLEKEISKLREDLTFVEKKLSNPKFVERAPEHLVAEQKEKRERVTSQITELEATLKKLKDA